MELQAVAVDSEGFVWRGTPNGGLGRLDPSTGRSRWYRGRDDDSTSIGTGATRLLVTSDGQLWAGAKHGLAVYDRSSDSFVRHPLPPEVPPGPQNPLGECALYLSKTGYLIHGTNKPASIGLKATNGCMRLYPENVKMLYDETPVNTPVAIVNQPYLVGQRNGVLYMEAHTPLEDSGVNELERIYGKLRDIEKKSGRTLDWGKVKEVQAEARGIPVPILEMRQGAEKEAAQTIEVEHPDRLYGRPEIPELKTEGWYVLAADVRDEIEAQRIAAIINHQGPPIPARVLSKSDSYRVIAGPFNDASEAKDAAKRLKIDLDIDGVVIEPVKKS